MQVRAAPSISRRREPRPRSTKSLASLDTIAILALTASRQRQLKFLPGDGFGRARPVEVSALASLPGLFLLWLFIGCLTLSSQRECWCRVRRRQPGPHCWPRAKLLYFLLFADCVTARALREIAQVGRLPGMWACRSGAGEGAAGTLRLEQACLRRAVGRARFRARLFPADARPVIGFATVVNASSGHSLVTPYGFSQLNCTRLSCADRAHQPYFTE